MNRILLQLAVAIVALAAALLCAAAAIGFLSAALYFYLVTLMTPALAALVTGLAAFAEALFILAFAHLVSQILRGSPRPPMQAAAQAGAAGTPQSLLIAQLLRLLQNKPNLTLLMALAAGVAVGISPGLRKTLHDLLRD